MLNTLTKIVLQSWDLVDFLAYLLTVLVLKLIIVNSKRMTTLSLISNTKIWLSIFVELHYSSTELELP